MMALQLTDRVARASKCGPPRRRITAGERLIRGVQSKSDGNRIDMGLGEQQTISMLARPIGQVVYAADHPASDSQGGVVPLAGGDARAA